MAPLEKTPPEQEPGSALHSAGHSLGFCLLTFPISTFSAALLIGLRDSLLRTSPSVAPLWILLGLCALFFAWAVLSLRSARRGLFRAGMPPHEVQRQISAMWIAAAVIMLAAGLCVLGYLAVYRRGGGLFSPVERPFPLAVTFILYVLAGALLLGRNSSGGTVGSAPHGRKQPLRRSGLRPPLNAVPISCPWRRNVHGIHDEDR